MFVGHNPSISEFSYSLIEHEKNRRFTMFATSEMHGYEIECETNHVHGTEKWRI